MRMQALIQPEVKLKIASLDSSSYQARSNPNNLNLGLGFKFYQKLFVILLTSCVFLIFPESPKDAEVLCKKYHSEDACMVW